MSAGARNKLVTFQQRVDVSDEGGGYSTTWQTGAQAWASFRPERGYERMRSGRIEATLSGVVTVDATPEMRAIDETHSVLIDGEAYQIQSISNPDQCNRFLEMTVEKGVAL